MQQHRETLDLAGAAFRNKKYRAILILQRMIKLLGNLAQIFLLGQRKLPGEYTHHLLYGIAVCTGRAVEDLPDSKHGIGFPLL